jgi:hypothetical protein
MYVYVCASQKGKESHWIWATWRSAMGFLWELFVSGFKYITGAFPARKLRKQISSLFFSFWKKSPCATHSVVVLLMRSNKNIDFLRKQYVVVV